MVKVYDADVLSLGFEMPIYERDVQDITEQAGYMDAATQVNRLIKAGVTLQQIRMQFGSKSQDYEYTEDGVPSDPKPDPTLSPDFDLADASALLADVEAKKAAYEAAIAKLEAAQKEGDKGETSPESGVPSESDVSK